MSRLAVLLMSIPAVAQAEAPQVVTDIPPVHALTARVMDGVGEPMLILPPSASPHDYALRPSEARMLTDADMVFWVGAALTPWLENSIDILAEDARSIALLDIEGLTLREMEEHEDHGHDHGHHHEGDVDPHAWLDPEIGALWMDVIAAELSLLDPDNAEAYAANAAAGRAEIEAVEAQIEAVLEPIRGQGFVVFHDAYGYFEDRFDFPASGSIALGDAADPGVARMSALQEDVAGGDIRCVFGEAGANPGLATALIEGTSVKMGTLDPLGVRQDQGANLYSGLLLAIAEDMSACLTP